MDSSTARDSYLTTEVRTATPQKLQLLLIDAALRSSHRARQFWQEGRDDMAVDALVHAQAVVGQMLAGIDRDTGGDLAERVSVLYEFVFRSLVAAGHRRDEAALDGAVRVLEVERETWRQLCEQAPIEPLPPAAREKLSRPAAPHFDYDVAGGSEGFSIEA